MVFKAGSPCCTDSSVMVALASTKVHDVRVTWSRVRHMSSVPSDKVIPSSTPLLCMHSVQSDRPTTRGDDFDKQDAVERDRIAMQQCWLLGGSPGRFRQSRWRSPPGPSSFKCIKTSLMPSTSPAFIHPLSDLHACLVSLYYHHDTQKSTPATCSTRPAPLVAAGRTPTVGHPALGHANPTDSRSKLCTRPTATTTRGPVGTAGRVVPGRVRRHEVSRHVAA